MPRGLDRTFIFYVAISGASHVHRLPGRTRSRPGRNWQRPGEFARLPKAPGCFTREIRYRPAADTTNAALSRSIERGAPGGPVGSPLPESIPRGGKNSAPIQMNVPLRTIGLYAVILTFFATVLILPVAIAVRGAFVAQTGSLT